MRKLDGAVVVITGAASGIGRATALAFARHGAHLHIVDIDEARLEAARAEVAGTGARATAHVVDCSSAPAVADLAAAVYAAHGRCDVLHNNAGVCVGGHVESIGLDDWRWIVGVNLWGVVNGVSAFVPRMIAQGGGAHIVNTASMAGLVGLPYVAPYCATKFAVVGLSESLNAELAVHSIRVTVVCTGAIRTNVMGGARLRIPQAVRERIERGVERVGSDPDRVARRIVSAVRKDQGFVVMGGEMRPLWSIRNVSVTLYQALARAVTARLLR